MSRKETRILLLFLLVFVAQAVSAGGAEAACKTFTSATTQYY